MKKCELSKETQDVLKKILRDIEWVRNRTGNKIIRRQIILIDLVRLLLRSC